LLLSPLCTLGQHDHKRSGEDIFFFLFLLCFDEKEFVWLPPHHFLQNNNNNNNNNSNTGKSWSNICNSSYLSSSSFFSVLSFLSSCSQSDFSVILAPRTIKLFTVISKNVCSCICYFCHFHPSGYLHIISYTITTTTTTTTTSQARATAATFVCDSKNLSSSSFFFILSFLSSCSQSDFSVILAPRTIKLFTVISNVLSSCNCFCCHFHSSLIFVSKTKSLLRAGSSLARKY